MVELIWVKRGALVLFFSFAILLPASYIPFLGFLFFPPFSDAVLLGLSACVTGLLPIKYRVIRIAFFIFLWIVLSLFLDIINPSSSLYAILSNKHQGIRIYKNNQQNTVPPLSVSVTGHTNSILTAHGYDLDVRPTINVAGMRDKGITLIDSAYSVDIPNNLLSRGIIPNIGGSNYPRLTITNTIYKNSSRIQLVYFNAANQISATYDRKVPLPHKYPGLQTSGIKNLVLSVFYFNLWREIFGFIEPIDLNKDLDHFLDITVGNSLLDRTLMHPSKSFEIVHDEIITPQNLSDISAIFNKYGTTRHRLSNKVGEENLLERIVCGKRLIRLNFGGPSSNTSLNGLVVSESMPPVLLNKNNFSTVYCDASTQNIIALSPLGTKEKPLINILIYDTSGRLLSTQIFQLPRWLSGGEIIVPDSWKHIGVNGISFQMIDQIRWMNSNHNEEVDNSSYRFFQLDTK